MKPIAAHRAFTLLEVLLALSVLSMICLLVGAMWMQARGWSDQNASSHESMRLQRVCELLRSQWADRRTSASLDDDNRRVLATPESLTFITATPILYPDWPLVVSSYEIERQPGSPLGEAALYTLRYSETPLGRLDKQTQLVTPSTRTLALLSGVRVLRWERYGAADSAASLRTSKSSLAAADRSHDDPDAAPAETQTKPEDRVIRWRTFTAPDNRLIPAVRLLGEYNKEPLSCVFVVEALR